MSKQSELPSSGHFTNVTLTLILRSQKLNAQSSMKLLLLQQRDLTSLFKQLKKSSQLS